MRRIFPHRTLAFRLWLGAFVVWLAVTAIAAVSLWHLRQDAVGAQERELRLLSLALIDEIDRSLQGVDEGFRALRLELNSGRMPVAGPAAESALGTRAELMPLIRKLWLIDGEGRRLAGSDATPAPSPSSFAPPLDRLGENATAVSRPFVEAAAHDPLVALAARFAATGGTASGWVVAAMPVKVLLGAFSAASPGPDTRMAVFRDDGVLLAGSIIDLPLPDEPTVARRLLELPNMEVRRLRDGSDRMVSLHGLPRYGLKIILTRDMASALGAWRKAVQVTAAGIALLLLLIAVAVSLVVAAERREALARNALLAQRSRSSKLESLGTLAGGVAHDFNNVLAAILGFGEMARDAAAPGSDQARQLDKVLKAALRGKALIERILTFSRGSTHHPLVFELEPVVEEVLTLLASSLRPGVILERRFDAPGARVRGDPTQAVEAIMNLCTNAIQAMPEGGMLSVELRRMRVATPRVLSHSPLPAGDYLSLSVADQGRGIEAAVMERLFEPFFSTRDSRSGTGLGLAVVHGVVAEFGGAIDVQSAPGRGARFTFYFPESTAAPARAAPPLAGVPVGRGQRLLVVDDEPGLVALAEEVLTRLGYVPEGHHDPQAALAALRAEPGRFALLMTDEVMPGLSGTQLAEAARQIVPGLPVLLISGYGGVSLSARAAAAGVTRVLSKPLQRAELAQALAELLH